MTTYLTTIAGPKLKPRSLDDYWSKTRNDIVPGVGRHRLDKLGPEHLERMYADMLREGHAPSHVLTVHRILSRALKIAHRRRTVVENVVRGSGRVRRWASDGSTWTWRRNCSIPTGSSSDLLDEAGPSDRRLYDGSRHTAGTILNELGVGMPTITEPPAYPDHPDQALREGAIHALEGRDAPQGRRIHARPRTGD